MIVNLFDYLTFDLDFYVHFSSSLSCCIYLDCALHVLFSCAILIAFSLLTLIVLPSASLFYLFCTCNCNAFLSLARFFGHLYLVLLFMAWHFIPVLFYWRPLFSELETLSLVFNQWSRSLDYGSLDLVFGLIPYVWKQTY